MDPQVLPDGIIPDQRDPTARHHHRGYLFPPQHGDVDLLKVYPVPVEKSRHPGRVVFCH